MNSKIYFNQFLILFLIPTLLFSQQISNSYEHSITSQFPLLNQKDVIALPSDLQSKVLSGKLIQRISQKRKLAQNSISSLETITEKVVIYLSEYPTPAEITALEEKNVKCYLDIWTPPMENHPYGFFIAEMPITQLNEVL